MEIDLKEISEREKVESWLATFIVRLGLMEKCFSLLVTALPFTIGFGWGAEFNTSIIIGRRISQRFNSAVNLMVAFKREHNLKGTWGAKNVY